MVGKTMRTVHLVKFDPETVEVAKVHEAVKQIKKMFKQDLVIAYPYGLDLLLDIPVEEIIKMRNELNEIINERSF